MKRIQRSIAAGLAWAVAFCAFAASAPTDVHPGFNLFSPKQDVELGWIRNIMRAASLDGMLSAAPAGPAGWPRSPRGCLRC